MLRESLVLLVARRAAGVQMGSSVERPLISLVDGMTSYRVPKHDDGDRILLRT